MKAPNYTLYPRAFTYTLFTIIQKVGLTTTVPDEVPSTLPLTKDMKNFFYEIKYRFASKHNIIRHPVITLCALLTVKTRISLKSQQIPLYGIWVLITLSISFSRQMESL